MKLSQLTTDQALDTLCRLTPYISNIASDKEIVTTMGKLIDTSEKLNKYGSFLLVVDRIGEVIPLLLRTHREDVYGLLSVLNDKEPEEIAAQNLMETMSQAREVFADKELLAFFKSSAQQAVSG